MKKISIIIVNWNSREFLERSLRSIEEQGNLGDFEVFVVDNSSTDGSAQMVKEHFPEIDLIQNHENPGYAKANNQAIQISRGEYLLLMNPDTILCPGAVEALLTFMDRNADAGITGPRLLNSDGSLQPSGKRFPTPVQVLVETFFQLFPKLHEMLKRGYEEHFIFGRNDFEQVAETDEVSGACLLVRRQVIEEIGPLDEDFFLYYEDVDLCYRAKHAGWRVFVVPQARVVHHWGINIKGRQEMTVADHHRSRDLFFRKHHGMFAAASLRTATVCLLSCDVAKNRVKSRLHADLRDDLQRTISANQRIIRSILGGYTRFSHLDEGKR